MKIPLLSTVIAIAVAAGAQAGVLPVYVNNGTANSPQIDSTVFINNGIFNASSSLPFTTQDTLFFTNNGSMVGSDGFRFDYETATGHGQATNFVNNGSIEGTSLGLLKLALAGAGVALGVNAQVYSGYGSYIYVDAKNVDNSSGYLGVDSAGVISLSGTNVNLSYSGLRASSLPGASVTGGNNSIFIGFATTFGNVAGQSYLDDNEIYDIYGGIGTNQNFAGSGQLLKISNLFPQRTSTGRYAVLENGLTNIIPGLPNLGGGGNWAAYAYTNQLDATDIVVQVFFVNTNNSSQDPNFQVEAGFAANPNASTQLGKIAIAKFSLWDVDPITGNLFTNSAYVLDDLASITNAVYLTNLSDGISVRPSNLAVTFGKPLEWAGTNDAGNTPYSNSLLYNTNFLMSSVTNVYSAYSATVAESPSASPTYTSTDPSNYPGRIEVNAQNLDVSLLRLQSEGPVTITTVNLTNNSGAAALGTPTRIDSEFLNINMGSQKYPITIKGYVPTQVRRLNGTVAAWSATWTNYVNQTVGAGTTNATTNLINYVFFASVMDQSFQTVNPGQVLSFRLHSTDAEIQDSPFYVTEQIALDVTNFTVSGSLFVTFQTNLDASSCPKLRSLTISPTGEIGLIAGGSIVLGLNSGTGLSGSVLTGFTNTGLIEADSVQINAQSLINGGQITTLSGPVTLQTSIGKLDFGTIAAQGNVNLVGSDIKGQGVTIQAGGTYTTGTGFNTIFPGALNLSVTNDFEDGGAGAGNQWTVYGGFNLLVKPQTGDLLGTSITTISKQYGEVVTHTWAGLDLGANAAVSNNVVLGQLVLDGTTNGLFSGFIFGPVGTSNALYTAYLSFLDGATNLANLLINPGFVIYFGGSSLPVSDLTNAFPGQLVYVPGLGSGVSPSSLRSLASAGALGQGQSVLRVTGGPNSDSVLSWSALGQTSYEVLFSTNILGPWQTVFTGANNASITLPMQARYSPSNAPQGFYKVHQLLP